MKNVIRKFEIKGLFEVYDVSIDFNDSIKIIAGENGLGKTTILNIFYYTISGNFTKLKNITFEKISIEFSSGNYIEFNKKDIFYADDLKIPLKLRRIIRSLDHESLEEFPNNKKISFYEKYGLKEEEFMQYSKTIIDNRQSMLRVEHIKRVIKEEVGNDIIYLPTYRRIENKFIDIDERNYINKNLSRDGIINFGMDDVKKRIDQITSEIRKEYTRSFSNISAEILLDMSNLKPMTRVEISDFSKIRLILDRIEENILSDCEKRKINNFIESGEWLYNKKSNTHYNYFLSKLITIYEKQRDKEEAIISFVNICNKYLINKEIKYNESEVSVYVVSKLKFKNNLNKIEFEDLSSGEKQIISLFAKIYLSEDKNYYILLDEPEISLSIEWQEMLLPDIIESGKCKLLFAVTHSPFIFNNYLENYTTSLKYYMEEI